MAIAIRIRVDQRQIKRVEDTLASVNPAKRKRLIGNLMLELATLGAKISAEEKIRRGGGGPPVPGVLTSRTGALRRSIATNRGPDWAEFGTDLVYGPIHELGGGSVRPGFPARPFLKPAADDVADMAPAILSRLLQRELDRA